MSFLCRKLKNFRNPCRVLQIRTFNTDIKIWDELIQPKGSKVHLRTRRPKIVTWYACGPTVYDSSHIGHASSYIRLDIIRRIIESQGLTILQVMGVTDIDDKIIARAQLLKVPWTELGNKYEYEFFRDLQELNIKLPGVRARVSQFIPQIKHFVSKLIECGIAYPTPDGSIYFDTLKYEKYGKFRESRILEMPSENEAKRNIFKRNPGDFAVWKACKPGEPFWDSPWGKGRPGWHIECSVMASHFFGPFLDVHSGGMDLTFPHHENEEAQCCARFGVDNWVSHWIHTGHLHLTGDVKMSKSIGNTVSIQEFLSINSPDLLRMLCLMKKYNTNIDYNPETESHAASLLKKLQVFITDCEAGLNGIKKLNLQSGASEADLWKSLENLKQKISESLINNFDTPSVVISLMDLIAEFNRKLVINDDPNTLSSGFDLSLLLAARETFVDFCQLVGLSLPNSSMVKTGSDHLVEPILTHSVNFRQKVRNFALGFDEVDKTVRKLKMTERENLMDASDEFRRHLQGIGIEIKDHGKESSWSFNHLKKSIREVN